MHAARYSRSVAALQAAAVTYPPQVRVHDGDGHLLRVIDTATLAAREAV